MVFTFTHNGHDFQIFLETFFVRDPSGKLIPFKFVQNNHGKPRKRDAVMAGYGNYLSDDALTHCQSATFLAPEDYERNGRRLNKDKTYCILLDKLLHLIFPDDKKARSAAWEQWHQFRHASRAKNLRAQVEAAVRHLALDYARDGGAINDLIAILDIVKEYR